MIIEIHAWCDKMYAGSFILLVYTRASPIAFSSMELAENPLADLWLVGNSVDVEFRWCEFLVRINMAPLIEAARLKLNPPIHPTIPTLLLSSPSTPRKLRRYMEAIAVIVMSPPCICCHHFKPFSEAIDESSHAVSL